MSNLKILVSVQESYRVCLPDVAEKLQAAGMQVEQWFVELGVITGSAPVEQVSALSQIEGVADIEPEGVYQLAPPESDIQ